MSTVDLYDILNLDHDCDNKDIKPAYRSLVKKFHPDHGGDAELFALITHAFNILKDPKSRKEYDDIHELSKQSVHSHVSLKDNYSQYREAENTSYVEKTKEEKDAELSKITTEFDLKHKYDRSTSGGGALSKQETAHRLEDLSLVREQDEIEYTPDELFQKGRFNQSTFNAMFDKLKEKGQVGLGSTLIKHDGDPNAWVPDSNYSSFDNAYDNVYVEQSNDEFGTDVTDLYGSFKPKDSYDNLTKDDVVDVGPAEYTESHNKIDDTYNKSLEDLMRERNNQTTDLHELDHGKYREDTGTYGIFDKIGIDPKTAIDWENDESMKSRYERLIKDRKSK